MKSHIALIGLTKYINADFNAMKSLEICERRGMATLNGDQQELGKLERCVQNTREFLTYYNP